MQEYFIIGSHAMRKFFPEFKREPADIDYLVPDKDFCIPTKEYNNKRVELHVIPPLYNHIIKHGLNKDVLLTLKVSHIFWDIQWEKTMFDSVFLFENGAILIKELFDELYSFWQVKHGKNKRSNLNMSAKDFFTNALKEYDHDKLHLYINETPVYTKILVDNEEVLVDECKFEMLSFDEKLDLVREEVYVMAFERWPDLHYRASYAMMIKKFIMNHAPIWEAFFIIANYRILHKPSIDFKTKILNGLSDDTFEAKRK